MDFNSSQHQWFTTQVSAQMEEVLAVEDVSDLDSFIVPKSFIKMLERGLIFQLNLQLRNAAINKLEL